MTAASDSKAAPPPPPRASNESGGMFSGLFASAGRLFGSEDNKPSSPPAAKAAAPAPAPRPAPRPQPDGRAAAAEAAPQPRAGADRAGCSRADARTAIERERLEPDERRRADSADRQLRFALGRDPVDQRDCHPGSRQRVRAKRGPMTGSAAIRDPFSLSQAVKWVPARAAYGGLARMTADVCSGMTITRTARGSACTSCLSRTGRPRCGRPCPRSSDRSD